MPEVTVSQSAANVAPDTAVYELARIINDLAAKLDTLTAKLDADAGVGDANYAATVGSLDTLRFRETGLPA